MGLVLAAPDEVILRLAGRGPLHIGGVLHGGAIMSLADSVAASAPSSTFPRRRRARRPSNRRRTSSAPCATATSPRPPARCTRARRRSSSRRTSATPTVATSPASPRRRPCCASPSARPGEGDPGRQNRLEPDGSPSKLPGRSGVDPVPASRLEPADVDAVAQEAIEPHGSDDPGHVVVVEAKLDDDPSGARGARAGGLVPM